MLRHARLAARVRPAWTTLAATARGRVAGPAMRRKKVLVLAGTALALAGAGSASAATTAGDATTAGAPVVRPAAHAGNALPPLVGSHLPAAHHTAAPASKPAAHSWQRVSAAFSGQATPAAAAQLTPVGTSGQQGWMPISGAQYSNATTIVQQVLAKKMGVRSAVIAIATAMQESRLQNLSYGSADSLGLFQQRPSAGWGTPQQILNPAYSANAFLTALLRHQQADPGWATQPLWATAQAVQASGFPTAYAQWESQAAGMVKQIATSLL
ncbi:MAG TPA: hypothetical protein VEV45_14735 [Streptosporangiaceae bacterium]|nr:hypothetical protein [Streptosporangiaceae bacterium]